MQILKCVRQVPSNFAKGKERETAQHKPPPLLETASRTISQQGARPCRSGFLTLPTPFPGPWALLEKPGPANRGQSCSMAPSTAVHTVHQANPSPEQHELDMGQAPPSRCPTVPRDSSGAAPSPGDCGMGGFPRARCGLVL